MEAVGTMSEGEWNSFSGMSTEEADFMAQLLGNYSYPNEQEEGLSTFFPSHDEPTMNMAGNDMSSYFCSDIVNSNLLYFPQGSSYSSVGNVIFPTSGHENYHISDSNPILVTKNSSVTMDCMANKQHTSTLVATFPGNLMEEAVCLNEEMSSGSLGESGGTPQEVVVPPDQKLQSKRKLKMPEPSTAIEEKKNTNSYENPKKKYRVSRDLQRNKRNVQSKKNNKLASVSNDEEETNTGFNRQSSSSYSSEDDSNASQELNGGEISKSKGSAATNLNGKARASRGSATDPQSLYARKRRERINERLRILQNLVPNGTKVDISTMLEEAVQYVKFLQLQIKLLSSDDLWMYAPIAYNGMDIGLDLKISL